MAVYTDDDERIEYDLPVLSIGSLYANHIVLDHPSVSRRHCVIVNYPDDVWVYDLGSTVGTWVGGERVVGRMYLDGVHEVKVGRSRIRVAAKAGVLV